MIEETLSRRPLTSRDKAWAQRAARFLKEQGVLPNTISVFSVVFAAMAAAALWASAQRFSLESPGLRLGILALVIAGIFGRLLCNLFDGMVAVEGGLKTASGEVYNDLPDRISDLLIFVALGFAAVAGSGSSVLWISLGWLAASLSILTAYIRYLGAGCGVGHFFLGPMAKQHRMATTIAATIASLALEPWLLPEGWSFRVALIVISLGAAMTCVRRTAKVARTLEIQQRR